MLLRTLGTILLTLVALWAYVTQPLLPGGHEPSALRADPDRLRRHVDTLATDFVPRDAAHPDVLARAAAHLAAALREVTGNASLQTYDVGGNTYHNVIATLGPATAERVIVGAHYDADGPYPAADDNASGVAGLLELARHLSQQSLAIRVELVAYTLEEMPYFRTLHMGSAVHVASLKAEGADVRLMISLESIGYFTDAPETQAFPFPLLRFFYPTTGNFIAVIGDLSGGWTTRRVKQAMRRVTGLSVHSLNAPRGVPGVDFSDHKNFWDAGYPAVMVTDTAFYRNAHYHTAGDVPETLDYARMARVVEGVYAIVLAFTGH